MVFVELSGKNAGILNSLHKSMTGIHIHRDLAMLNKVKDDMPLCAIVDMEFENSDEIVGRIADELPGLSIIRVVNDTTPYLRAKRMVECTKGPVFSYPSECVRMTDFISALGKSFKLNNEDVFFHGMMGVSKQFGMLKQFIHKTSHSKLPVLIEGESGTGKELIARAIHAEGAGMNGGRFVAINCGALPHDLVENELFGHEAGAFSGAASAKKGLFEEADNGTLFIDEIGEMDYNSQSKFLRVLENGTFRRLGGTNEIKVNVRLLAATNKVLENEIEKKTFRLDLYYRLCVLKLYVKPLRERPDDIPLLAERFARNIKPDIEIMPEFIEGIINFKWPGNVRELKNVVESAVIMSDGILNYSCLPEYIRNESKSGNEPGGGFIEFTQNTEKEFIIRALKKTMNNKTLAAEALGITRYKLYRKMEKYGL
jgi:transcriptional regulator with PAS, ATPase and Fis domain